MLKEGLFAISMTSTIRLAFWLVRCLLSILNDAVDRHLRRYLVEAPPNICTPTHLANAAAKIAEGASDVMKLEILEKADCEKLNMGCYLAVAACSEEPPKFIHLTYKPKGISKPF